jgi:Tfp pilus assembly protein PilX
MKKNKSSYCSQRGVATLFISLILSIISLLAVLSVSQTGVLEQSNSGNDLRAKEAFQAAEAGLDFGISWAKSNDLDLAENASLTCAEGDSLPCPSGTWPDISSSGSTSSESFNFEITFTQGVDTLKVRSVSTAASDSTISASVEAHIKQTRTSLGDINPPTLVSAGCITTAPTGNPDMFLLSGSNDAIVNAADCSAYDQQGHIGVQTWSDDDGDYVMDASEEGSSTPFTVGSFSCGSTNCSWDAFFNLGLADAKSLAATHSNPPCGAPTTSPSIYLVNNSGPINSSDITGSCPGIDVDDDGFDDIQNYIGSPTSPVILIIPSTSGCPKFNGTVTIFGVVYYESTTACSSNGWGGATVYGSVMWEGDVDKPNANTQYIEVDYDNLGGMDNAFNMTIEDAVRLPGTWRDQ